ncbi:MAG: glycosyltransferase, partial [Quadrisphaera sp.]
MSRLISSLLDGAFGDMIDIVLVNNSPEISLGECMDRRVTVVVLENPGYGAAMNRGALALDSNVSHLLLLTHEVSISDETIAALMSRLNDRPSTGIVGPLLLDSRNSDLVWSAGNRQRRWTGKPKSPERGMKRSALEGVKQCDWLDGATLMVRLQEFRLLGGFDERFFLYVEDVELGWRYRSAGFKVECLLNYPAH